MRAELGAFLSAFSADWVSLVSGSASVVLACVGALWGGTPGWWFWGAALLCLLVAAFRVWVKEHRAVRAREQELTALHEQVPVTFTVSGIPVYWHSARHDFFFVPEVTIANPSHTRPVSISVALLVQLGEMGSTVCPPGHFPVEEWERSRYYAGNQYLAFPLNLQPQQTMSGYIAFRADALRGVKGERSRAEDGRTYLTSHLVFSDPLFAPPREIYKQEVQFSIEVREGEGEASRENS
jgi:hypothetical protein